MTPRPQAVGETSREVGTAEREAPEAGAPSRPGYLQQVAAIVWKDLLVEIRTRERVTAMAAFTVLVGALFNFALDFTVVRPADVASGLIWMTLVFAGLIGVGRTFQLEQNDRAFVGTLLSPTPRDAIYFGKVIASFLMLALVIALVLLVFGAFFGLNYGSRSGVLAAIVGLGGLGFVALVTLFAALSANTTMGETLLPVLVFPLLVPMVTFGASATSRVIHGRPMAEIAGNVRMLGAFTVVALFAGAILFRYVVEE